jgi:hypothetical protein
MYCWAAHVPTLSGALPFAVALRSFNPDFAAAAMLWCWVLAQHDSLLLWSCCVRLLKADFRQKSLSSDPELFCQLPSRRPP